MLLSNNRQLILHGSINIQDYIPDSYKRKPDLNKNIFELFSTGSFNRGTSQPSLL
jgi:hypothetical protein